MNGETNPYEAFGEPVVVAEMVEVAEEPKTPWGFWATVGFSIAVLGAFLVVQTAVAIPFALAAMRQDPGISPQELAEKIESDGLLMALATLASAPVGIGLTLLFASLRRGLSVARYLALKRVPLSSGLLWCSLVVLFMFCSDGLTYLTGRDVVPVQMTRAYETAVFPALLWIAVLVGAPLFEELFFRGFVFRGIQRSRLGGVGAILLTALIWAGIHLQYDVYQMATIFLGGLLLGLARLKTESVYLTILMHAIWNAVAMAETMVCVHW